MILDGVPNLMHNYLSPQVISQYIVHTLLKTHSKISINGSAIKNTKIIILRTTGCCLWNQWTTNFTPRFILSVIQSPTTYLTSLTTISTGDIITSTSNSVISTITSIVWSNVHLSRHFCNLCLIFSSIQYL